MNLNIDQISFHKIKKLTYEVNICGDFIAPIFEEHLKKHGVSFKLRSIPFWLKNFRYNYFYTDIITNGGLDLVLATHSIKFKEETDEALFLFHFSKNIRKKFSSVKDDLIGCKN